jgi:hypothetical protein
MVWRDVVLSGEPREQWFYAVAKVSNLLSVADKVAVLCPVALGF